MTYEVEILWGSRNIATIWGHAHDDAHWNAQKVTWNIMIVYNVMYLLCV